MMASSRNAFLPVSLLIAEKTPDYCLREGHRKGSTVAQVQMSRTDGGVISLYHAEVDLLCKNGMDPSFDDTFESSIWGYNYSADCRTAVALLNIGSIGGYFCIPFI
jgi:hypothetical protein